MATFSFWTSEQYRRLRPLSTVLQTRLSQEASFFTDVKQLKILDCYYYFVLRDTVNTFNKKFSHTAGTELRPPTIATCASYLREFFSRYSYARSLDPLLALGAALMLAYKSTEIPLGQTRVSVLLKDCVPIYPVADILEAEHYFFAASAIDSDTIRFLPFSSFEAIAADLLASKRSVAVVVDDAWVLLNDSFATSCCLAFPPHVISLACIFLAASLLDGHASPAAAAAKQSTYDWFSDLSLSTDLMDAIHVVCEEILEAYSLAEEISSNTPFFTQALKIVNDVWESERASRRKDGQAASAASHQQQQQQQHTGSAANVARATAGARPLPFAPAAAAEASAHVGVRSLAQSAVSSGQSDHSALQTHDREAQMQISVSSSLQK